MNSPSPIKTIGLLAYDDMQALDLAGPLDVFGAANALASGMPPYGLHVIGVHTGIVHAENGLAVLPAYNIEDAPPLDTLLIPGGIGSRLGKADPELLGWLRRQAETARRVVSVCTGAYMLAATGLLDGRRVATHWQYAEDLARRFPAIHVEPERLFLRDGRFATSGGLTAGIDLALALVEEDLGAAASLAVARYLVMYVTRPGNQAQFSAPLAAQVQATGRMGALVDWLLAHLKDEITSERMAEQVSMSPRHFRRVFADTFGTSPARFVEHLRLEQACLRLTRDKTSIDRVASSVGFRSADVFRRAFRARYGATPTEYRQRFAR
ncbi:MAG: GlxA family transcriptional regulator [Xanthomonadaceae bacterium]|nr:GlxA family transcriptional regulator [Xanthomonadaceae bacterium]MDE2248715.1 GlxA family transcriptional regulator [Xanthomonadaceae bacterium]